MNNLELLPLTREVIESGIKEGLHSCCQLHISQYGETIANFAIGEYTPGKKVTEDSIMSWMSCSKMITAAAIAILQERKKLNFDDSISHFLPSYDCKGKQGTTIKHVLTHTCGIRTLKGSLDAMSWEETIAAICAMPIEEDWTPGGKAGYHPQASWFLLGEIISQCSGLPYWEFINQEIFLPLGMENCWFNLPEEVYLNESGQYEICKLWRTDASEPRPAVDRFLKSRNRSKPGSSGCGPAKELSKFMQCLQNGGEFQGRRILSANTVELMHSRIRQGMRDLTFNKTIDWGLGIMIDSKQYNRSYPYSFGPYSSEETFGHNGNQSSACYCDPEHELTVTFIFNGMPGEVKHKQRLDAMNKAIYEDLDLD